MTSNVSDNLNEDVTISQKEYKELQSDSIFLQALIASGVDNWDGYGEAQEMAEDMA